MHIKTVELQRAIAHSLTMSIMFNNTAVDLCARRDDLASARLVIFQRNEVF